MSGKQPNFTALDLNPAFIGSNTDDWLEEEGFSEAVHQAAIKELLAEQLAIAMKAQGLSKSAFAQAIKTSRSQLDRILNPHDEGVTIATLQRAAAAVGMRLRLDLIQVEADGPTETPA